VLGLALVFPKLTQVVEFLLMAAVLAFRPQGLFGVRESASSAVMSTEYRPLRALSQPLLAALGVVGAGVWVFVWFLPAGSYALTLLLDLAVAFLFAASLHWLLAPSGVASFGHAALFGVGAYAAGLLMPQGLWAALWAGAGCGAALGVVSALLTAQMTGVYRAMLTLAIAQLLWSASIQWDGVTGGSNGLTGAWPAAPFDDAKSLLWLALGVCAGVTAAAAWALTSRWGLQLRALRDSPLRAASLGLRPLRLRASSFAASGWVAGLAGALYVAAKGSVAPDVLAVHQSVNGLVMVLLGGVNSLTGALSGAVAWTFLSDWLLRNVPYWRAALGGLILLAVLVLPNGISGLLERRRLKNSEVRYV
jgi:branched-chain amino acid transport system permease protein